VVDKQLHQVICIEICQGKCHDFRLFKESKLRCQPRTDIWVDSGYQGIQTVHANSRLPHKRRKQCQLTAEQRQHNRQLACDRVLNENVIGKLKRFKIIADKYRNRRKRFGLRFNLIAGIYNWELNP